MTDLTEQVVEVPAAWQDRLGATVDVGQALHRQVMIETWHPRFGEGLVICDEGITDLIDQLIRAGIMTAESCQGYSNPWRDECVFVAFEKKKARWVLSRLLEATARRHHRPPIDTSAWEWQVVEGDVNLMFPPDQTDEVTEFLRLDNERRRHD